MEFAVPVKVVPDLDQLRFDPEKKSVVREGTTLYANPFDLRAIRVALDLRRPGETVSVLSMGPPAAEPALREALAQGVDRALLLTDRAFAGADTLATSRVLARALERVGHGVVLAGVWTTDSETGQVPPEVAGLLGVPVVSSARAIERDAHGDGFTITRDTPDGWERLRIEAPFVASVDEKIAKLRRPSPAEVAAVPADRVERWTAATLGLDPGQVGGAGSPTIVESLHNEAPGRVPLLLDSGSVEDRVHRAVARLDEILARPAPAPPPVPARTGPLADPDEVLVLVTDGTGALSADSLPLLTETRRTLPPLWPTAVWVGPPPDPAVRRRLADAGALDLKVVHPSGTLSSRRIALAVEAVLASRRRAAAMIFLADPVGREVAGQVASRRALGLTGDAVGVRRGADGEIRWAKPSFGGGIVAEIRSRTRPSLATVRPGAFAPGTAPDPAELDPTPLDVPVPESGGTVEAAGREREARFGDLDRARVVLAVGMGVGGPDHLPPLLAAAARWGGAVGASRRVVDIGWLPRQLQVGLTGRSIAPALGVLVGISGSPNHLVGWKRARALLAVNPQPAAPVHRAVDVGIVGRWEEVLPVLEGGLTPLAERLGSTGPSG